MRPRSFSLPFFLFQLVPFLFAALPGTAQHCQQVGMMPPTVTTDTVTYVDDVSATVGGIVTNDGGGTVAHRGMVWAASPNPTTADALTNDGTGTGSFISTLTGLIPGTTYHVRAFAANASGTVYGTELTFTMPILPTVITAPVTSIGVISANSGGEVTSDGGGQVTARGICYATSPSPVTTDNIVDGGSGLGGFISNLNNLYGGQTYYLRAYATNTAGTSYGNEEIFETPCNDQFNTSLTYGTMTDQDGIEYKTILIGAQEWMAENLKTTTYRNGDSILTGLDISQLASTTEGVWVHYSNNSGYECPYGKLYNWYAVDDPRELCPLGWHVPTDAEWTTLTDFLGGASVAGAKMKALELWPPPNTNATNEVGFSGLPGGFLASNGYFNSIGGSGYWWSSSLESATYAWFRSLQGGVATAVIKGKYQFRYGHSVRCLRD